MDTYKRKKNYLIDSPFAVAQRELRKALGIKPKVRYLKGPCRRCLMKTPEGRAELLRRDEWF